MSQPEAEAYEPADARIVLSKMRLASLAVISSLSFAGIIGMPFNIPALAQSLDVSNSAAGILASVEMAGFAISSLLLSQFVSRVSARRVYIVSLTALALLNAASVGAHTLAVLCCLRGLAGAAAAAVVVIAMSTASRSSTPELSAGVLGSAVGIMGSTLSLLLPPVQRLTHWSHLPFSLSEIGGIYVVYVIFAGIAFLFVSSTPDTGPLDSGSAASPRIAPVPLVGWVALFGLGLISLGQSTLLVFLVSVGIHQVRLSAEAVGVVYMFGSVFGIVAPLIAGYIGTRFEARVPSAVILSAICVFALILSHATAPSHFYLSAPFFISFPLALVPIVLGALSRIEPTGRLVSSYGTFIILGSSFAPAVGGAISSNGSYANNGWFVVICTLIGTALLYPAVASADRLRRGAAMQGSLPGAEMPRGGAMPAPEKK